MEGMKILVERDTYTKNGQEYFSYFISAKIRGKEKRIGVVPPDNGGYEVLDIVFGNEMSAELVLKPYEIKTIRRDRYSKATPMRYVLWTRTALYMNVLSSPRVFRIKRLSICF